MKSRLERSKAAASQTIRQQLNGITSQNRTKSGFVMIAVTSILVASCAAPVVAPATSSPLVTTSHPSPVATTSTTQTPSASTTTTAPPTDSVIDEWILEPTTTALPEKWTLKFVIGYGEDEALLGSAPGGENLTLGPDFGAQAPDGTWWFLDGAKRRLAHYDPAGIYLDAVELPVDYLVDGTYFQFQLPRVLADGTLVATRFDGEATEFLTVSGGNPSRASIPGTLLPRADDGSTIYGFDFENALWAIDPVTADQEPVEWFVSQAGSRYRISTTAEGVVIELPDIGVERMIPLKAGIGPGAVHASMEVATGADGVIHLLFLGVSESDETTQLGGYTTITANGEPTVMEPIVDPFTPADPGSPAHLGVTYGSATPWFMMIGEQGVEVYVRR